MPTIEVTDQQYDRLDALREELADEFVGAYGTVRHGDAVEYLLDRHAEADVSPAGERPTEPDESDTAGENSGEDATGSDAAGASGSEDAAEEGADRLAAMMNLLDEHDGKWREIAADEGNYEVDLPDGDVEVVRTKDDVRAVLFSNY